MKEVPKKDSPDVSGGDLGGDYPKMPWAPIKWPPPNDGPTIPEEPLTSPCEAPTP